MNPSPNRITVDVLGIMACSAMILAAYFFGVRARMDGSNRADRLQVETGILRAEINAQTEAVSNAEQALQTVESQMNIEGLVLSDANEVTGRLIALGAIAEASGVVVETLTPRALEPGKAFDRQPISFRCIGSYPACVDVLEQIRTQDPTLASRSVSLRRNGSAGEAMLDVDLVWFVRSSVPGN
jgi:Tfp pilus assembly protein PilO